MIKTIYFSFGTYQFISIKKNHIFVIFIEVNIIPALSHKFAIIFAPVFISRTNIFNFQKFS